jgi:hypothetical protein
MNELDKVIRVRVCNVCESLEPCDHRDDRLGYLDTLCREVYGTALEAENCCMSMVSRLSTLPEHQQKPSVRVAKAGESYPTEALKRRKDR